MPNDPIEITVVLQKKIMMNHIQNLGYPYPAPKAVQDINVSLL